MESGEVKTITELARRIDLDKSYVIRIMKLTMLAPDIIEAIKAGNAPEKLGIKNAVRLFPINWEEQRTFWGMN